MHFIVDKEHLVDTFGNNLKFRVRNCLRYIDNKNLITFKNFILYHFKRMYKNFKKNPIWLNKIFFISRSPNHLA